MASCDGGTAPDVPCQPLRAVDGRHPEGGHNPDVGALVVKEEHLLEGDIRLLVDLAEMGVLAGWGETGEDVENAYRRYVLWSFCFQNPRRGGAQPGPTFYFKGEFGFKNWHIALKNRVFPISWFPGQMALFAPPPTPLAPGHVLPQNPTPPPGVENAVLPCLPIATP